MRFFFLGDGSELISLSEPISSKTISLNESASAQLITGSGKDFFATIAF